MSNPELTIILFGKKHILDSSKHPNLIRIAGRNKSESFCYLPYLRIFKSQKVQMNIYCNFANELLCLRKLLYHSNMDLFAFLMVIWQHLQQLNLHSQYKLLM